MTNALDIETQVFGRRVVDVGRLFLLCALVGVIAGLGAAAFHYLLQLAKYLFLDGLAGFRPPGPLGEFPLFSPTARPLSRWVLFMLPAGGGLIAGIIVYWLAPEAEGHGTDAAIDAYHHHEGNIRTRVPFVKTIASAITIGTGGSAGREGPIAQIGAGLGSALARWLKLPVRQRRILMAAGLGAGIGAIFRAPLAGALFAAEVLYREMDLEYEVIAPAILSSIVAYSTFGSIFGWDPLFFTPNFTFSNPLELGPYLLLALVVALGGRMYAQVFYGVRDYFAKLGLPNWSKPALGGLVVGAIGLVVPQALSTGFGVVQGAFDGKSTAGLLLLIAAAKILATAFTVASGGSGGVFGPAVVIGGALGGATGLVFHAWWPHLVPMPGAFALVGMAGFFAASAHVPISTVIMVSEMTGNYELLVPAMFVCMLAFLLVRRHTIYEKQLPMRSDSPGHRQAMARMLLERLRVNDVLTIRQSTPPPSVREGEPLTTVFERFSSSVHTCFSVVDENDKLTGVLTMEAVRYVLGSGGTLANLVVAKDMSLPAVTVERNQTFHEAVAAMVANKRHEVLVVDAEAMPDIVGVLTDTDITAVLEGYEKH